MPGDLRRDAGVFLVGMLAFAAPVLEGRVSGLLSTMGTVGPFAFVAAIALASIDGPIFGLFARNGDRSGGRLSALAAFALAVTGLAALVAVLDLPAVVLVAAVFILTLGNLGQSLVSRRRPDPIVGTAAFATAGAIGGVSGVFISGTLGATVPAPPVAVFAAVSGAILGALIKSALYVRNDPIVLLAAGLLVWFLLGLGVDPTAERVAIGLALTVALGYVAYALETASVTGMLTGVLLALFAVVLGGYGWFVLLVTFFGLGGLASKYRYDDKLERGIAEANEGARGSGNVLANSAVALVAVVAYAASDHVGADPALFEYAFAGAVAAALADTFSSEFGGLFDDPRLLTTFESVEPGTDGGVTWQGSIAGVVGAATIASLGGLFFEFGLTTTLAVFFAGFFGMLVDSLLGATLEGKRLGNQSVNLLATLSAGLFAAVAATGL